MRRLRWKGKYATGLAGVDEQGRCLVETFNNFADAMGTVEHCQDMTELAVRLAEAVDASLAEADRRGRAPDRYRVEQRRVVQDLATSELPLAARDGPACKDCGLCDELAERFAGWFDAPKTPPETAGDGRQEAGDRRQADTA